MKTYNIASIEGDGIGKEVVPEAHKVLKKIIIEILESDISLEEFINFENSE